MLISAYFASLSPLALFRALPGSIAQGLIWGLLALGVYITYKLLLGRLLLLLSNLFLILLSPQTQIQIHLTYKTPSKIKATPTLGNSLFVTVFLQFLRYLYIQNTVLTTYRRKVILHHVPRRLHTRKCLHQAHFLQHLFL